MYFAVASRQIQSHDFVMYFCTASVLSFNVEIKYIFEPIRSRTENPGPGLCCVVVRVRHKKLPLAWEQRHSIATKPFEFIQMCFLSIDMCR